MAYIGAYYFGWVFIGALLQPVIAQQCYKEEHPIQQLQGMEVSRFEGSGVGHYNTMVLDTQHNRLIVGGKNHILFFNDTSLELQSEIGWNSTQEAYNDCTSKGVDNKLCENYLQQVIIHKDKLYACATNSMSPMYKVIALNNTLETLEDTKSGMCSSSSPDHHAITKITRYGEMISATYTYLRRNPTVKGLFPLDSSAHRLEAFASLRKTTFVTSVYARDAVYMFFMESGEEVAGEQAATVARVCETDNGPSPIFHKTDIWTTLRKTRLKCTHTEGDNEFKNLVDVTYDSRGEIFYAAFTMSQTNNIASAICSYTLEDLEKSFDGDFLQNDIKLNVWHAVSNGGFLNGCKVNKEELASTPSDLPPGKEPTNFLNRDALGTAAELHLMAQPLRNHPNFQFMMVARTFTKLTVESQQQNNATILLVTTDDSLLTLYKPAAIHPCVVEEIQTNIPNVKSMLVNNRQNLLYLSSDEVIVGLKLENCANYTTKETCTGAHNPRCGWNNKINQCTSWNDQRNTEGDWEQDLNKCPKKDPMGEWGDWHACVDSLTKRACKCRQRKCEHCDLSSCDQETMQVQNCTAGKVGNVTAWFVFGAQDGDWSAWSQWEESVDHVMFMRERVCVGRKYGGQSCEGNSLEYKAADSILITWSEWGEWDSCAIRSNENETKYRQRRRNCTMPSACPEGESTEHRFCFGDVITWSAWSACNCNSKLKVRFAFDIPNCSPPCAKLGEPHVEDCSADDLSKSSCEDLEDNTASPEVNERTDLQKLKNNNPGMQLSLRDIILVTCAIVVTCLLVSTLVVVVVLKRKRCMKRVESNEYGSPRLIKNNSVQNFLEEQDYRNANKQNGIKLKKLAPVEPTQIPLINHASSAKIT